MAKRPIFVPSENTSRFFDDVYVEFDWHSGFAPSQKKRNIAAMHDAAKLVGLYPLLEVSTKSEEVLGQRLSAFNLRLPTPIGEISIESAYQGSKVFEFGGPYIDLYKAGSREAKKDARTRSSGRLIGFDFFGDEWPTEPVNAFYDWLYLSALHPHKEYLRRLFSYKGFTDVEFNPAKSVNCQARTCAILVSLLNRNQLDEALETKSSFLRLMSQRPVLQALPADIAQRQLGL